MKPESKLHAVPNVIDRFCTAVAERDAIRNQSAGLQARIAALEPLERAYNEAQTELTAITSAEAHALEAWARDGAVGRPPEPDHKARERAAAKLAQAQHSLRAAGVAKAQIERELVEINQRMRPAQDAVEAARAHVLGEELLRLHAEFLRVHDEHARIEHRFSQIANALHTASPHIAHPYTAQVQQTLQLRLNTPSPVAHEAAAAHQRWWTETFGDA